MTSLKIIKAWVRYSKKYIQIGTGRKGESSNFQFLNNKLYKTWKNIENPNALFNFEDYGISLKDIEDSLKPFLKEAE
ncbi:hypothetical protein SAMN02745174_02509 [Cetobacterium ceti]|uniref:Uncharacterized protein n=1 Tax=Cetobacterium ceti TaxID=180163 RepID=A0A1T4QYN4_9FUSO|nr:hypothetical protein [Cetobacterium ceti]SKA08755.1 hypothetical protein SAMN02745174_02509 [Cetobacterium ceti]